MPRILTVAPVAVVQPLEAITRFQNRQLFTASGTFNVPANVSRVWVSAWGGGGSAGNDSTASRGGGGQGGSGIIRALCSVTPSGTVTVTIGTGGAEQTVAGPGNAGAPTTFGALLSVNGGAGGFWPARLFQAGSSSGNGGSVAGDPIAPYAEGVLASGQFPPIVVIGSPSSSVNFQAHSQGGLGAFGSVYGRGGGNSGVNGAAGEAGALIVEW